MLKNIFEKIYIIGNGITALKCAEVVAENFINFKFLRTDRGKNPFFLKRLSYQDIEIVDFTESIQTELANTINPVLILSVNNTFIFPAKFLENKNIIVINYHNSFLPLHRGMNAEAWSIFEGDAESGVSWHLVDNGIDTGPIICQSPIPIYDDTTSISLLQAQSVLATALLERNFRAILANEFHTIPNNGRRNNSIHYKSEIPGDSFLDFTWPNEKIWRFLRAMDYGPYYNLGIPKIRLGSDIFSWRHYSRKNMFFEKSIFSKSPPELPRDEYRREIPDILKNGSTIIINNCFYLHETFKVQGEIH